METTFGEFVKARRMAQRITLRAFSEALGYDPANYSRIERGLMLPPTNADKLSGFARELGMSTSSGEFRELVRLASIGRGEIPPSVLSNDNVAAKLPILFRTLEGDKVDESMLDELFEAMKPITLPLNMA